MWLKPGMSLQACVRTQVVQLAVAHAMEATRGQREVFGLYRESMHDAGAGADGRSPFQIAKAAAQERGEHIFAKPDHLGIQVHIRS